jgi:hypothetical protein
MVMFDHRALSEEELGPAVWKIVGSDAPPQVRERAARGALPLGPRDLVAALYQLWATNAEGLVDVVDKTIADLPPPVLTSALEDRTLPAGALDLLGRKLLRNGDMLDLVVRHPAVADETLAAVARLCPDVPCQTLVANQQRWLGCPAIVEALYHNPNARMSDVHHMLELAVREGIDVKLPAMAEIRQALAESEDIDPERDDLFQQAAQSSMSETLDRQIDQVSHAAVDSDLDFDAVDWGAAGGADDGDLEGMEFLEFEEVGDGEEEDEEEDKSEGRARELSKLKPMEKIRLAMLGTKFERSVLIRDSNRAVALATIKSPKIKENEAVAYAANRSLSHDVIREIANNREWTKLYSCKLNLVMNPKTPMSRAMSLLGFLHPHDVRKVASSKNVPSALAGAAKRRVRSAR